MGHPYIVPGPRTSATPAASYMRQSKKIRFRTLSHSHTYSITVCQKQKEMLLETVCVRVLWMIPCPANYSNLWTSFVYEPDVQRKKKSLSVRVEKP